MHAEQARGQIMIHADEIRKRAGQIEFPLTDVETAPWRMRRGVVAADLARSGAANELNLSGSQVFIGTSVLAAAGLLMWALLKLWLFEL
jgi:hypothetical protein